MYMRGFFLAVNAPLSPSCQVPIYREREGRQDRIGKRNSGLTADYARRKGGPENTWHPPFVAPVASVFPTAAFAQSAEILPFMNDESRPR